MADKPSRSTTTPATSDDEDLLVHGEDTPFRHRAVHFSTPDNLDDSDADANFVTAPRHPPLRRSTRQVKPSLKARESRESALPYSLRLIRNIHATFRGDKPQPLSLDELEVPQAQNPVQPATTMPDNAAASNSGASTSVPSDSDMAAALAGAGAKIATPDVLQACVAAFAGSATPEQLQLIARAKSDSSKVKSKQSTQDILDAQQAIFAALPDPFQSVAVPQRPPASVDTVDDIVAAGSFE